MRRDRDGPAGRPGFSVPPELIRYKYLRTAEKRETEEEKKYSREKELAFFIVEFGMSKKEYGELTPAERAFIYKAWEDKIVRDTTYMRDAVMNAEYNVNRKKGRRFRKLWTPVGRISQTEKRSYTDTRKRILEIEKEKPTDWVRKIYEVNGWIKKKKGGPHG